MQTSAEILAYGAGLAHALGAHGVTNFEKVATLSKNPALTKAAYAVGVYRSYCVDAPDLVSKVGQCIKHAALREEAVDAQHIGFLSGLPDAVRDAHIDAFLGGSKKASDRRVAVAAGAAIIAANRADGQKLAAISGVGSLMQRLQPSQTMALLLAHNKSAATAALGKQVRGAKTLLDAPGGRETLRAAEKAYRAGGGVSGAAGPRPMPLAKVRNKNRAARGTAGQAPAGDKLDVNKLRTRASPLPPKPLPPPPLAATAGGMSPADATIPDAPNLGPKFDPSTYRAQPSPEDIKAQAKAKKPRASKKKNTQPADGAATVPDPAKPINIGDMNQPYASDADFEADLLRYTQANPQTGPLNPALVDVLRKNPGLLRAELQSKGLGSSRVNVPSNAVDDAATLPDATVPNPAPPKGKKGKKEKTPAEPKADAAQAPAADAAQAPAADAAQAPAADPAAAAAAADPAQTPPDNSTRNAILAGLGGAGLAGTAGVGAGYLLGREQKTGPFGLW